MGVIMGDIPLNACFMIRDESTCDDRPHEWMGVDLPGLSPPGRDTLISGAQSCHMTSQREPTRERWSKYKQRTVI